MRIRLDGTRTEISYALYRLRGVFTITSVSRLHRNRDRDRLSDFRVYVDINPWDLWTWR
jgi:hypothetical protein